MVSFTTPSAPKPATAPRVCCLDLDTFFVSVERLFDPSLVGKPVVVGGQPGQRGVVTAASYEVREYGVRSGMSLTRAAELAPHAIFVSTRHGEYGHYAEEVREIAKRYSPVIRVASIDEMFIDFRGCERLYARDENEPPDDTIHRVVLDLQAAILDELGLPASAGIATSKAVAKIASGLAKPAGVLIVRAGTEAKLLAPLPVRKYPGIGPVGESKLAEIGIKTLGHLAAADEKVAQRVFGAMARTIQNGARGVGSAEMGCNRPAFREHDPEGEVVGSISNERTFMEDVRDPSTIDTMLCGLCERVCWRARKRGVKARTVTLRLRYSDFDTITRSRTGAPTDSAVEVFTIIRDTFARARTRRLPIRLLGVALSNLGTYGAQLSLFDNQARLHGAIDTIRERFGYEALGLAMGRSGKNRGSR